MKINYQNENIIDDSIYIHDSVFESIVYNYNDDSIFVVCVDYYKDKRKKILFKNVIYMESVSCDFWMKDQKEISNWELIDGKPNLNKLLHSEDNKKI